VVTVDRNRTVRSRMETLDALLARAGGSIELRPESGGIRAMYVPAADRAAFSAWGRSSVHAIAALHDELERIVAERRP
jgi:hypothetical protein